VGAATRGFAQSCKEAGGGDGVSVFASAAALAKHRSSKQHRAVVNQALLEQTGGIDTTREKKSMHCRVCDVRPAVCVCV
jgi:hypothetical protein